MPFESANVHARVRFGADCELDTESYTLRRGGRILKLERIPMEILLLLVERRGRLVTREQIVDRIWGKAISVDTDNGINAAIRKIRQVLKDDPEKPTFIETVTAKGYRFIAQVEAETPAEQTATASEPQPQEASTEAVESQSAPLTARRMAILLGVPLILIAIATVAIFWTRLSSWSRLSSTTGKHSQSKLAVLPFVNLTGDATQDYFSDGLTEEMIQQLSKLDPHDLGVIARTSVTHYKNTQTALTQIGHELGVQYVLEGSVRRDSGRVRITVQLIQVSDQTHVWSRQYDRELSGLLALQGEVAGEVADEIHRVLGLQARARPGDSQIESPPTSYETYDLYLKGRYFWNKRTQEGFRQAAEYFQQAIDKDPNYAPAYAGLADTYGLMSTWGVAPQNELMPRARAAALKAVQLDDNLAAGHASLALISENYDYDWLTAEKEFRRALQLNPHYPTAHQWYAEYLSWQGRFDEAFAESELARQLDPLSLIIATDLATTLYYSRQYDRAIKQCRTVLEMDPMFDHARVFLIRSYVQRHEFEKALDELKKSSDKNSAWSWAVKTYIYGQWGRTEEAHYAFHQFEQLSPKSPPYDNTSIYAYTRAERKADVIRLLEKGRSEHSNVVLSTKVDPIYDWLRDDVRFQRFLKEMNLSD